MEQLEKMRMIDDFKEALGNLPPGAYNFFFAGVLALLRVMYDAEETRPARVSLEVLMCGFLGMGAGWALTAMGSPEGLTHFAAATIGYIGQQEFRKLALKFLNRKIGE